MTYQFRALAEQAQADGRISDQEILGLRQAGWADGRMDQGEADAIFALNDRLTDAGPDWADFFVEALSEFVLAGGAPRGFISDAQAEWLIAHFDRDGRVETMAELALLGRVFDKAERLPERLKAYALAQIEQIVVTGKGPTRDGANIEPGHINSAECALLRRFVFSFAGDTAGGVSQGEAEMLFRIKDATLGAANAPEWETLFVQGVGNYLSGHPAPGRFFRAHGEIRSWRQFRHGDAPGAGLRPQGHSGGGRGAGGSGLAGGYRKRGCLASGEGRCRRRVRSAREGAAALPCRGQPGLRPPPVRGSARLHKPAPGPSCIYPRR